MTSFIAPPVHPPFFMRFAAWLVQRITGQDLLPASLLAWYPKAAISSGVMEALVTHQDGNVSERLLKLVRMQVSFVVACPFCIDLNSVEAEHFHITAEEVASLQGHISTETVASFTTRERLALAYVRGISQTPPVFPAEFVVNLTACFDEREIVILATTAAQVNYWARLLQALGVPAAGLSDYCELPSQTGSGFAP